MATVGSHKGNRGRPYGLILLLAFGVALLGIMALHRVRERHIFNNLIQEKDNELNSLQLILQRERDQNRKLKRNIEEVKETLYSLEAKKMELDNRLLKMQSRVESIKEEQKTMESTLDEKQNEIKWLQERYTDSIKENPDLTDLMGRLKQKESEIEDLKHQLESSVKVWSVSTDDPSKNLTGDGSIVTATEGENLTREGQGNEKNSTHAKEGLNASAENRETNTGQKEIAREQAENLLTSENKDSVDGMTTGRGNNNETLHKKIENIQDGKSAVKNDEKNVADAGKANKHNGHYTAKSKNKSHERAMDSEVIKKTEDSHQEKLGNSRKEIVEPRRLLNAAVNTGMQENLRSAEITMGDRHGLISRMIAEDRLLEVEENLETIESKT